MKLILEQMITGLEASKHVKVGMVPNINQSLYTECNHQLMIPPPLQQNQQQFSHHLSAIADKIQPHKMLIMLTIKLSIPIPLTQKVVLLTNI